MKIICQQEGMGIDVIVLEVDIILSSFRYGITRLSDNGEVILKWVGELRKCLELMRFMRTKPLWCVCKDMIFWHDCKDNSVWCFRKDMPFWCVWTNKIFWHVHKNKYMHILIIYVVTTYFTLRWYQTMISRV